MSWRDKSWRYTSAADSAKPGYLKRKFDRFRKEREHNRVEAAAKVRLMKKVMQ